MHLLAAQPGGFTDDVGIIDLGQSAADIVILSAADSSLAALANSAESLSETYPSIRLANWLQLLKPAAFDLYQDKVLDQAKVVVVSFLGGASYWQYGFDRLQAWARACDNRTLILVPGDNSPDQQLFSASTIEAEDSQRVWQFLREGGTVNNQQLFYFLANQYIDGQSYQWHEPERLPNCMMYMPASKLKHSQASYAAKNTRIEEIMVEGQGFDIHLRNAWCKVGTVIVRGTVLSSSRLNCQLPFISRQCPALFVSFNQVDFTAVENMDWASESCSSRKQFSRLPVAVEARSLNAAWQENIRITNSWLHARLESAHNAGFPLFHETEILGTSNSFVARFSIRNKPTVRFVNPQKNPALGGGVLWVTGVDLRVGNDGSDSQSDSTVVGCVVKNGELIVGHAVSSAVGACEIPPLQLLRRIFSNNLDLADLRVAYASDTSGKKRTPTSNALSRINPSRGSVSGGTPVRITVGSSVGWGLGGSSSGNTNLDGDFTANAGCRFGTVAVSGRWSTINEVECITPSRGTLHGNVEVAPVMDHKTNSFPAFDLDAETTFKYALF